jgi:glucan phosphoethanolaminetransferase (alkaline phosphatase superfamily)
MGTHFPYYNTIPPALVKSNKMMDYRSSVKRNTISYLSKLSKIIDDKTIVFYTSDHGQEKRTKGENHTTQLPIQAEWQWLHC